MPAMRGNTLCFAAYENYAAVRGKLTARYVGGVGHVGKRD